MRARGAGFIAICLVGALPVVASGQTDWSEQLREQMERAAQMLGEDGYEMTGVVRKSALAARADEDQWFELGGGRDYVLVGFCDQDCTDFDVELFDATGREVYSDLEMDDVPMVYVAASEPGRYRASVGMVECAVEPCRYGLVLLARALREPGAYEALVREQLAAFGEGMVEEGYQRTHGERIGSLPQGETQEFLLRFKAGTTYGIAAFCDQDCHDLDLAVLGSDTEPVAQDVETDDHPAVDIDVTSSGLFRVRVSMPGCSEDPCVYGVALYGKPTSLP